MERRESSATNSYYTDEEDDEDVINEGVKVVAWPPQRIGDGMTAEVTTSVRYVTVSHSKETEMSQEQDSQQQQQSYLSKELFSPGKMDVNSRWKPPAEDNKSGQLDGAPRRKFKSLNEVLQHDTAPGKHITYHVPPGTTRTRKAQESYEKHLNVHVK